MRSLDAHVITGLYESVAGEAGLQPALAAIQDRFGCVGATILSFDPLVPLAMHNTTIGAFDDTARRIYSAEFAHLDPAPAAFAKLASGSVSSTNRLFSRDFRNKAPVLQEFLRPRGMDETIAGVISPSGGRFAMLALFRGPDRTAFDEDDFNSMHELLPHFAMALKLRRAFARLETQAAAMAAAMDRLPAGITVLGRDAAVHVNHAAEEVARRGDGLWFDRKGTPHAANRDADHLLQSLVADARQGGPGGVVRLPRANGAPPYVLLVAPLPVRTGLGVRDGDGFPAIVLLHDPSAPSGASAAAIAAAFDLPVQAAELIAALLRGEEAQAYAERRGLSYETVRYHLKTAFARTGARSRARLLQLVGLTLHDIGERR